MLPRFPITIEEDIPFLVVSGYTLAGYPEQPEKHVAYFRQHGCLRTTKLVPTATPFQALEALARSDRWPFTEGDTEGGRRLLGTQALRLVDSVYRLDPDWRGDLLPWGPRSVFARQRIFEEAAKLAIRWEPESNKYVFLDGKCLPEPARRFYRREIWKPSISGIDVELCIERKGRHIVSIWLAEHYKAGKPHQQGVLRVFDLTSSDKPKANFRVGEGNASFRGAGDTIEVLEGSRIQAELILADQTQKSPIYKP